MNDPKLLKESLHNFYAQNTVFYGFSINNNETALAQSEGTGYRTMEIVDSAIDSTKYNELGCGNIITREANKLSFIIPQNYRAVFAIVKAITESTGATSKYMRLMLGYGTNGETLREIARAGQSNADHRTEMVMLGSYGGIVADNDTQKHKLVVQTYGDQRYNSINILIGVTL